MDVLVDADSKNCVSSREVAKGGLDCEENSLLGHTLNLDIGLTGDSAQEVNLIGSW